MPPGSSHKGSLFAAAEDGASVPPPPSPSRPFPSPHVPPPSPAQSPLQPTLACQMVPEMTRNEHNTCPMTKSPARRLKQLVSCFLYCTVLYSRR